MRISTSTIFESGIGAMQQQTERLLRVQQQIASNRRIVTPADDPVAAARVIEVSQSQSMNLQYGTNVGTARDSLSLEESTLGSVTVLLQDVRDLAVNAGNPTLTATDRASLANELRGKYQDLLGLANSTDGNGQYLFSGYQGGVRPFSASASGAAVYNGDQGQRLIQISPSLQIPISDAGSDVFQRILNGNGTFVTKAAAGNGGSGLIDGGSVLDPALWNGAGNNKNLSVTFSVVAGVTTYDIIDNTTLTSLLAAPLPYVSGSNINFKQGAPAFDYGAQVNISGAPANGDSFTVKASTNQDPFQTISDLADLLETTSGAALTNGLGSAQQGIDNALANISTVRSSTGSRLKQLDSVQTVGDDRALQYASTLSRLQDLDLAKAASELTQQQLVLQAAQQSFAKISQLSLFNYL